MCKKRARGRGSCCVSVIRILLTVKYVSYGTKYIIWGSQTKKQSWIKHCCVSLFLLSLELYMLNQATLDASFLVNAHNHCSLTTPTLKTLKLVLSSVRKQQNAANLHTFLTPMAAMLMPTVQKCQLSAQTAFLVTPLVQTSPPLSQLQQWLSGMKILPLVAPMMLLQLPRQTKVQSVTLVDEKWPFKGPQNNSKHDLGLHPTDF